MKRRLLAIAVSMAVLLSMCGVTAFAEGSEEGNPAFAVYMAEETGDGVQRTDLVKTYTKEEFDALQTVGEIKMAAKKSIMDATCYVTMEDLLGSINLGVNDISKLYISTTDMEIYKLGDIYSYFEDNAYYGNATYSEDGTWTASDATGTTPLSIGTVWYKSSMINDGITTVDEALNNVPLSARQENNVLFTGSNQLASGMRAANGVTAIVLSKDDAVDINDANVCVANTDEVYTGKAITTGVDIFFGEWNLVDGLNYDVKYENNTKAGIAKVTVEGKGLFKGEYVTTFKILPKKAAISKVTPGSKKITVAVKSQKAQGATSYQIAYKKAGSSYKYVTTTSTSKTIKNLTKGKKYTVKVRAKNSKSGYGAWSYTKTVTVK